MAHMDVIKKFETVFEKFSIPFVIVEIVKDDEGKAADIIYRYANQAFSSLLDLSLEALLGQSHRQLFQDVWPWVETLAMTAFTGKHCSFSHFLKEKATYIHVECRQIAPGLCGCVVVNVTAEGTLQRKLELEQESFVAVLDSTGLDHWVYDIQHDRSYQSPSSQQVLGVPAVMENYPQSFLDTNMILPKYWNEYLEVHKQIRAGEKEVTAEYQIWPPHEEFPHWERLIYKNIFDEQGRPVKAIGTALDVSAQKYLEERFEDFLAYHRRLLPSLSDAFRVNISKNTIMPVKDAFGFFKKNGHIPMSRFFELSEKYILDRPSRRKYEKLYNRENLLANYKKGIKEGAVVCLYQVEGQPRQWLRFVINMTRDPATSDIIGFTYTENVTESKLNDLGLKAILAHDYELILRVDGLADRYVVFVYDGKVQTRTMEGHDFIKYLTLKEYHYLGLDEQDLSLNGILRRLEEQSSFCAYYEVMEQGKKRVKKLQFYMLERDEQQFCVGRSDVTNELYGRK